MTVGDTAASSLAYYEKVDRELFFVHSIHSMIGQEESNLDVCQRAKKVIIDCDPGGDDALALILALHLAQIHNIEILGITYVAGNGTLDDVVQSAQLTMTVCGNDQVPIYRGLEPFAKGEELRILLEP